MKITIYTITECQFSKQEKEYLSSHGLQFEEKNLETNREFLTEMLAVGNNFAGTPVTKIEKDDGQVVVLKGFTASEFDKALALAPTTPVVEPAKPVEQAAPAAAPVEAAPAPVAPAVVSATPPVEVPPAPTSAEASAGKPVADPAMASVLNTLEQKAAPVEPIAPPFDSAQGKPVEVPPAAPAPGTPTVPDPQF